MPITNPSQKMSSAKSRVEQTYSNPKQLHFLSSDKKTKVFIGGRGSGKTFVLGQQTGIRAGGLRDEKGSWIMAPLPRAKFGLFGPTMIHLKNNVVPSMIRGLKSLGYTEYSASNVHGQFVKFKKPPEHWATPYEKPEDYSNVITFANGYTVVLFSWFQADQIRGINLDGCDIDEAAMLEKDDFDKAIFPTIRGNKHKFDSHALHQQICLYTSMPWLSSGAWVEMYEDLSHKHPDHVHFTKSTSWDNVKVLGRDTLERWRREMSPLEYKVEIMCERIERVANCYYDEFSDEKHCYVTPFDQPFSDLDPDKPLYISFDFNAGFTCCVVGQDHGHEFRIIREHFVKGTKLVDRLIDVIATEYAVMNQRRILVYGDKMGNHRQINYEFANFYDEIAQKLSAHNFHVTIAQLGINPLHLNRFEVINKLLSESKPNSPRIRINKRACIYLSIALSKTAIKMDYVKDKSSESDGYTPPEQSTHLPDAFDYLVYNVLGKYIKERVGNLLIG